MAKDHHMELRNKPKVSYSVAASVVHRMGTFFKPPLVLGRLPRGVPVYAEDDFAPISFEWPELNLYFDGGYVVVAKYLHKARNVKYDESMHNLLNIRMWYTPRLTSWLADSGDTALEEAIENCKYYTDYDFEMNAPIKYDAPALDDSKDDSNEVKYGFVCDTRDAPKETAYLYEIAEMRTIGMKMFDIKKVDIDENELENDVVIWVSPEHVHPINLEQQIPQSKRLLFSFVRQNVKDEKIALLELESQRFSGRLDSILYQTIQALGVDFLKKIIDTKKRRSATAGCSETLWVRYLATYLIDTCKIDEKLVNKKNKTISFPMTNKQWRALALNRYQKEFKGDKSKGEQSVILRGKKIIFTYSRKVHDIKVSFKVNKIMK